MKYLKKFQTNADYQTFKGSSDYVKPNLSAIVESTPIIIFNSVHFNLQFPVTLIEGENGELGVALYEYLNKKYGTVSNHLIVDETFIIHIESYGVVNELTSNQIGSDGDGYCLYHEGGSRYTLSSDGSLVFYGEPV